ncbi:hypothetical protein Tco_1152242, partial [Tanacetum coccineum]
MNIVYDDYKDIHYKNRKRGGSRETSDCEKPGARNKDRNCSTIPIADNVHANWGKTFSLYRTVKGVYPADESGCRVIVSYNDETFAQTALNALDRKPCSDLGGRSLHIRYSVQRPMSQVIATDAV